MVIVLGEIMAKKSVEKLANRLASLIDTKEDKTIIYGGLLGTINSDGFEIVSVPNRANFVYVRLNGSFSEVIEAYNVSVALNYGAKVRLKKRDDDLFYEIISLDIQQYSDYGGNGITTYLPSHAFTHSFGSGNGVGSDPVFIYKRQLLQPMAVRPADNTMYAYVESDFYTWKDTITYFQGGNTADLTLSKPTGSVSRWITIYLNGETNSLGYVTGTDFSITYFSPDTVPYIPEVDPTIGIALASVLLKSNTTAVSWDNIYDLRCFLNPGGGTASLTGTVNGAVLFGGITGGFAQKPEYFSFNGEQLFIGTSGTQNTANFVNLQTGTAEISNVSFGDISSYNGTALQGTPTNPLATTGTQTLISLNGSGYDTDYTEKRADIYATAEYNWTTGSNPTKWNINVTPSGTIIPEKVVEINNKQTAVKSLKVGLLTGTIFEAQSQSADIVYKLPVLQGDVDTYLKNDGSGILSWETVSGGGGVVKFSGVNVYRNTAQSIPNATTTPVSFNTESYDTDDYWSSGNPTGIIIPETGYYHITAQIRWAYTSNVGERYAWIIVNNTGELFSLNAKNTTSTDNADHNISVDLHLNKNDYVQIMVYQNCGGALNLDVSTTPPRLSVHKLTGDSIIPVLTGTFTANAIQFMLTPTGVTPTEGLAYWNTDDGTLNVGMPGGNVNLQVGQEMLIRVKNESGVTINNGELVYVSGADGNNILVSKAKANAESTSAQTLAMATETILNNHHGYVTPFGMVRDLNTNSYTAGTVLYLSATTDGAFTNVKPTAPNHAVTIGYVVRQNATTGIIFVNINNGWELEELHDVLVTGITHGNILSYSTGTQTWVNHNLLPSEIGAPTSAGLAGGQTVNGGLNASDNLNLFSNSKGQGFAGYILLDYFPAPGLSDYVRRIGIGGLPASVFYKMQSFSQFGALHHTLLRTTGVLAGDIFGVALKNPTSGNVTDAFFIGVYGNAGNDPISYTYGYIGSGYSGPIIRWTNTGVGIGLPTTTLPATPLHLNGIFRLDNTSAPSSSPADATQLYSADVNGAGDAGLNLRTEGGDIYKFGDYMVTPGGRRRNIVTKTTTYSVTVNDDIVLANSATPFTITLPAVSGLTGQHYTIKNINTANITVDGNASETIDGQLTQILTQYESIDIVCNGSAWFII